MHIRALLAGLTIAGLAVPSEAANLVHMQPAPAYNAAAFNFDGFYLGAQGGGVVGAFSAGSIGVVAGVNFNVGGSVLAGVEFQYDALFNASATYDFFALGRLGVVMTDDFLLYGDFGLGSVGGTGSYAFGGGGEYALSDQLSLKGEVIGTGGWGTSPASAKLQAGLVFHMP